MGFDGYKPSPKDHEHHRRTKNSAGGVEIQVVGSNVCPVSKTKFLSNPKNKENFIDYLCLLLEEEGIETYKAQDDGDTLIVKMALSAECPLEVIAEDSVYRYIGSTHSSHTSDQ